MVVHRQLVEPAVCLSDLYDVFLLDIVRDTRQNLWPMIYRSQWPPNSMRSLTVLDWTSIQSMMHKWIIFLVGGGVDGWDKWNFLIQRIRRVNFFYFIKNPNLTQKKIWWLGRKKKNLPAGGGGGGGARVSDFFFLFSKESKSEKKQEGPEVLNRSPE